MKNVIIFYSKYESPTCTLNFFKQLPGNKKYQLLFFSHKSATRQLKITQLERNVRVENFSQHVST